MAVLAAALVAGFAPSAHATCYSSTPAATAFADSPVDGSLAPEITTIAARLDGACAVSVDPGVTRPLIDGDAVFVYLDVDGNPATGSALFDGADVAVGSLGVNGTDPPPLVGRFDPALDSFSFTGAPAVAAVGSGGFSASLDQLGVPGSPVTLHARVATLWSGIYYDYFDFGPEPGQPSFPFPVAFSTTPPPPPTPPAPVSAPVAPVTPPAPVTAAPVVSTSTPSDDACQIPALKRLRVADARRKLRRAGCRYGSTVRVYSATIAAGRVIRSLPKAGTSWDEPVDLEVSKGRRPRRHRATRAVSTEDRAALMAIAARRLDAAALGAGG